MTASPSERLDHVVHDARRQIGICFIAAQVHQRQDGDAR
jgi:hypothetical protein